MTAKARRSADADRPLNWPDDPEDVTAADIDFEALAHVLANTCRRGGCCRQYHSVAAQAVIVSEEIAALDGLGEEDRRTLALHALLADAPSAWLRGRGGRVPNARSDRDRTPRHGDRECGARSGRPRCRDWMKQQAELLRFVTRMAAATESRDLLDGDMAAGAGVAFPPLKRRIRPVAPDKVGASLARPFPGARRGSGRFRQATVRPV